MHYITSLKPLCSPFAGQRTDGQKTQQNPSLFSTLPFAQDRLSFSGSSLSQNHHADLPSELASLESTKAQKKIAKLIAWIVTNPGDKVVSLPRSLLWQCLPNLKRVRFDSADVKLSQPNQHFQLTGYWSPASIHSKSCVVLVHGYCGGPRNFVSLTQKLNEKGYNVFMPELRAHGKRNNHRESTIGALEGLDILGAIQCLDKKFKNQTQNLCLMGHSMGAVSIMTLPACVSSEKDRQYLYRRVQKIILDSPYASRSSALNARARSVYNQDWLRQHPKLQAYTQGVCKAFIETMNQQAEREGFPDQEPNVQPADIMSRYPEWLDKVCLLIHGKRDQSTPYADGEKIHEVLSQKKVQHHFVTLPDADHIGKAFAIPPKRKYVVLGQELGIGRWPFPSTTVNRTEDYAEHCLNALNESKP